MLRCGPWNRLPLTIRWLDDEFERDFPVNSNLHYSIKWHSNTIYWFQATKKPPDHMKICRGHIILRSKPKHSDHPSLDLRLSTQTTAICDICYSFLSDEESSKISCLNSTCRLVCHLTCLANDFLECGQYVPISGYCPLCRQKIIWGDLVRKRNGCSDTIILIDDK